MNWLTNPPSRKETYIAIITITTAISIVVFVAGIRMSMDGISKRLEAAISRLEKISVQQTNHQSVLMDGEGALRDKRIREIISKNGD